MTLDEVANMTLDQVCDGGSYPGAGDVRAGVATGEPGITGSLHASTLGLHAADLRSGTTVDNVVGTLAVSNAGQILKLSQQGA